MAIPVVHPMKVYLVLLLPLLFISQADSQCPMTGSTKYCGYSSDGTISGDNSSPCSCQPYFCCSKNGFCGPEPGISGTGPASDYCGAGCQSQYGTCTYPPAPTYFEYIGTLDTPSTSDTLDTQAAINSIPLPSSSASSFYFIVFVFSDQQLNKGSGKSTGTFGPVGLYNSPNNTLTTAPINYLKARAKVMVSIGGDTPTTKWNPAQVTDEATYISTATASLLGYYQTYGFAGFDIDYEETIAVSPGGSAEPKWLRIWCQIITNLKQNRAVITFAPFDKTKQAYKDLQNCLASKNVNVDFILYQTDTLTSFDTASLTTLLTGLQTFYAPTKVVPTLGNMEFKSNAQIPSQVIKPLLASGVISGAAVFDADTSLAASPPFTLEKQLWAS